MDNYAKNYIDTFHIGINNTKYKIFGEKSEQSSFFYKLNELAKKVKQSGGRFFLFGNGASASFSNHMALDWSKNGGILALCLSDSAMLTALANDFDFEDCFLEFLSQSRSECIMDWHKFYSIRNGKPPNLSGLLKIFRYVDSELYAKTITTTKSSYVTSRIKNRKNFF